jgi:nitrite reductase/ring-hydroxylating ferredoxin subunit
LINDLLNPDMKRIYSRYLVFLVFLAVISAFPACDKNKDHDEIPFAYVNFRIYPNSTFYWRLNSPQGWEYITAEKPSRGIIVYRLSMTEFMAYERTCPHDPLVAESKIEVEASSITAACPVCESKYILLDGTPFQGPARRPLKQYRTNYDGNSLHIFN